MLGIGRSGPLGRADSTAIAGVGELDPLAGHTDATDGRGVLDPLEREAWVVVSGAHGVGPVSFERLLTAYGSARAVLDRALARGAPAEFVAVSRAPDGGPSTLTPEAARAIVEAARDPDRLLATTRASGVAVLTLADEAFPSRLRRIDLPPPVLFVRGDVAAMGRDRAIAIVGTRRPTDGGRSLASRIADAVAGLGATIVSGLALGIDAAAHAAAVRAGAPTVAVIGGGHDRLYPAAHRRLAEAIAAGGGAVISEFAPHVVPSRGTFPRRNRIISGLADATVVVEAGARSGALTTAAWALEQGRGLHIVPGRIGDPAVAGCLAFLREAAPEARIVAGVAELIEDLGLLDAPGEPAGPDAMGAPPRLRALLATLGPVERAIATAIVGGVSSVDELVAATGSPGATVLGALTALEIRGYVLEAFGRYRVAGPLAHAHARARHRPRRPAVADAPGGRAA